MQMHAMNSYYCVQQQPKGHQLQLLCSMLAQGTLQMTREAIRGWPRSTHHVGWQGPDVLEITNFMIMRCNQIHSGHPEMPAGL